jgi:hypothetical protein
MQTVRKEPLGRMAVFLIPSKKLKRVAQNLGGSIGKRIEKFLLEEYGGFTVSYTNSTGWWKAQDGTRHFDKHREYKVSFPGKERIAKLDEFLAQIATEIGEECIYVETGEDSWLVYAFT